MGYTSYSNSDRGARAMTSGYATKAANDIFLQNKEGKTHESMLPRGIKFRECRDSETHPFTVPIQLYLDETGSMGRIPHELIKDGLPTLMSSLLENGVKDASLMFAGIGDHLRDGSYLQVGQFESGDKELDMWLERVYLEGNGGGNGGESYMLAWYFAAFHTIHDAWEKRGKKGFVITVGDEPCHRTLEIGAVRHMMGESAVGEVNYDWMELLEKARQKNHVYHIHIDHGSAPDSRWKEALGKNFVVITDHKAVARTISDIILSHKDEVVSEQPAPSTQESTNPDEKPNKVML